MAQKSKSVAGRARRRFKTKEDQVRDLSQRAWTQGKTDQKTVSWSPAAHTTKLLTPIGHLELRRMIVQSGGNSVRSKAARLQQKLELTLI